MASDQQLSKPVRLVRRPRRKFLLAVGDSLAAGYQPDRRCSRCTRRRPVRLFATRDTRAATRQIWRRRKVFRSSISDVLARPPRRCWRLPPSPSAGSSSAEFGVASPDFGRRDLLIASLGRVGLVTLDIGANDLDHCLSGSKVNTACCLGRRLGGEEPRPDSDVARGGSAPLRSRCSYRWHETTTDPFLGVGFSPAGLRATSSPWVGCGDERLSTPRSVHVQESSGIVVDVAQRSRLTTSRRLFDSTGKRFQKMSP